MVRVKSIAKKRKSYTNTMSGGRVYSTVGLNSRILAVLKSSQETKRFSFTTNYVNTVAAATDMTFYVNCLANLAVGTGFNNRIGNKIIVDRINVTMRYLPVHALCTDQSTISADLRAVILETDGSFPSIVAAAYAPVAPFVYSGFPSTGCLNNTDVKIIGFKDKHFPGQGEFTTALSAGVAASDCTVRLYKKFGKTGHPMEFVQGSSFTTPSQLLIVGSLDVPGRGNTALASTLRVDLAVDVFFRDS